MVRGNFSRERGLENLADVFWAANTIHMPTSQEVVSVSLLTWKKGTWPRGFGSDTDGDHRSTIGAVGDITHDRYYSAEVPTCRSC